MSPRQRPTPASVRTSGASAPASRAQPILVAVGLVRIGPLGAVVAHVPDAVPILIVLPLVLDGGAVVAQISGAVPIQVVLRGVLHVDTVVNRVDHAVAVHVVGAAVREG